MKEWEENQIRNSFKIKAELAESYVQEVKMKAVESVSYQRIHDEHLAKWYACYRLYGRTGLSSPIEAIETLEEMKSLNFDPSECFDKKQFQKYYLGYLEEEIIAIKKSHL